MTRGAGITQSERGTTADRVADRPLPYDDVELLYYDLQLLAQKLEVVAKILGKPGNYRRSILMEVACILRSAAKP